MTTALTVAQATFPDRAPSPGPLPGVQSRAGSGAISRVAHKPRTCN